MLIDLQSFYKRLKNVKRKKGTDYKRNKKYYDITKIKNRDIELISEGNEFRAL